LAIPAQVWGTSDQEKDGLLDLALEGKRGKLTRRMPGIGDGKTGVARPVDSLLEREWRGRGGEAPTGY